MLPGRFLKTLRRLPTPQFLELAAITDSSRTTIYRMLQKMGYANYLDFHHDLKQAVNN